jgi:tRNA-specific 2-thiouridylase
VKIRYRAPAAAAIVVADGVGADVRFLTPQAAVTPGQAAVFYVGDEVLGGGAIERATHDDRPRPAPMQAQAV